MPANTDLDLTATPELGYKIEDWSINGQPAGWTVPKITLHLGDLDVKVGVTFSRITNLVHVTAGPEGQLQPAGNSETLAVPWGESVLFSATPDPSYHADIWTVNEAAEQVGGGSFLLARITSETWLRLAFAQDTYAILAKAGDHGSIEPANVVSLARGDNQLLLATPAPGYQVGAWRVDGTVTNFWQSSLLLTNVQTNHTVEALFAMPMLCGERILGRTRTAAERDLFSYTAGGVEERSLRLQGCGPGTQAAVELYHPSGQAVFTSTDCGTAALTFTTAGTYLIFIGMQDGTNPRDYSLSLTSPTCTNAPTPLACEQTLTNRAFVGAAPDLYTLPGYAGEALTIRCSHLTANSHPQWTLYSPSGRVVYGDDLGLEATYATLLKASGTYLVAVKLGGSAVAGDYRLELKQSPCADPAVALACGQSITNLLAPINDLGYPYRFIGDAGEVVTLTLTGCSASGPDLGMEVYDPDGDRIYFGGLGCGTVELTLGKAGTNLVMVHTFDRNSHFELGLNSLACVERPPLRLERQDQTMLLSWPLWATNWVLDVTVNLSTSPVVWATVPPAQYQSDADKTLFSVAGPWSGNRFYRLRRL